MNERQLKFVHLYHETGNASSSYRAAGYKSSGKSAEVSASKLLRIAKVKNYLEELKLEARKEHKITIERIIEENAKLAFQDLNKVLQIQEGEVSLIEKGLDFNLLDGVSISSSKSENGTNHSFSIKLSTKLKALQELPRLTGAYENKPEDNSGNREANAESILESLRKFTK